MKSYLLGNVIANFFNGLQHLFIELIHMIFYLLYLLTEAVCKFFVMFPEALIKGLMGIKSNNSVEDDIVIKFIKDRSVQQVFWLVLGFSVALLVIFTVFAMIKSEFATDASKAAKGPIIGRALKGLGNFFIVPIVSIAFVFAMNVLTGAVANLFGGTSTSLAFDVFQMGVANCNRANTDDDFFIFLTSGAWIKYETSHVVLTSATKGNVLEYTAKLVDDDENPVTSGKDQSLFASNIFANTDSSKAIVNNCVTQKDTSQIIFVPANKDQVFIDDINKLFSSTGDWQTLEDVCNIMNDSYSWWSVDSKGGYVPWHTWIAGVPAYKRNQSTTQTKSQGISNGGGVGGGGGTAWAFDTFAGENVKELVTGKDTYGKVVEEFIPDTTDNTSTSSSSSSNSNVNFFAPILDAQLVNFFYDLTKFHFIVALGAACVIGWNLFGVCVLLIKRAFDLVLLFVLSPVVVSFYPLDDGSATGKWRGQFRNKVVGIVAPLFAYNMFFVLAGLFKDSADTILNNMGSTYGLLATSVSKSLFSLIFQTLTIIVGLYILKSASKMLNDFIGGEDLVGGSGDMMKKSVGTALKVGMVGMAGVKAGLSVAKGAVSVGRAAKNKMAQWNNRRLDRKDMLNNMKNDEGYQYRKSELKNWRRLRRRVSDDEGAVNAANHKIKELKQQQREARRKVKESSDYKGKLKNYSKKLFSGHKTEGWQARQYESGAAKLDEEAQVYANQAEDLLQQRKAIQDKYNSLHGAAKSTFWKKNQAEFDKLGADAMEAQDVAQGLRDRAQAVRKRAKAEHFGAGNTRWSVVDKTSNLATQTIPSKAKDIVKKVSESKIGKTVKSAKDYGVAMLLDFTKDTGADTIVKAATDKKFRSRMFLPSGVVSKLDKAEESAKQKKAWEEQRKWAAEAEAKNSKANTDMIDMMRQALLHFNGRSSDAAYKKAFEARDRALNVEQLNAANQKIEQLDKQNGFDKKIADWMKRYGQGDRTVTDAVNKVKEAMREKAKQDSDRQNKQLIDELTKRLKAGTGFKIGIDEKDMQKAIKEAIGKGLTGMDTTLKDILNELQKKNTGSSGDETK